MRVAYFGPEGTFTQEALISATAGQELDLVSQPTIYDTVMAVHFGSAQRALVPIENSLEGSVNATLDALAMETEDVAIIGEVIHPIRHCLIARTALELSEIETVVSHPQATAQCARFIRSRLPHATVLAGSSTAEAVRTVAEHDGPWAALGNRLAAERYRCQVLRAGVEDVPRQRDAVRLAGAARRATGRTGLAGAAPRPVEDRGGVLGRRVRGARLARALPVRVRQPRGQPDPDRIAARASRASGATCSSSTSRAATSSRTWPTRSLACAPTSRCCGCLGRSPRRSRSATPIPAPGRGGDRVSIM